jgi:hypothetical protein
LGKANASLEDVHLLSSTAELRRITPSTSFGE